MYIRKIISNYNNISVFFLSIVCSMQIGCALNAPNKPYRTIAHPKNPVTVCGGDECSKALIERHDKYDLAFVEFTERGNLFNRDRLNIVLSHIKKEVNENPVQILVYVHGWNNNANTDDVRNFRHLLESLNENKIQKNRKVIGVYIGWRGQSFLLPPLNYLTYWARKNVARQVGSGGVSEVLQRLKKIVKDNEWGEKNVFVVAGHSFGAAVIASAVKGILLERIINAKKLDPALCTIKSKFEKICKDGCYKTEAFGDGIILLNPAIEANEFVQLKELVAEQDCYTEEQPKLIHIISSDADKVTQFPFRIGQILGTSIRHEEEKLERIFSYIDTNGVIGKKNITLEEYDLDTQTIGNYCSFRTGTSKNINNMSTEDRKYCSDSKSKLECYIPCEETGLCIEQEEEVKNNIPVSPYEPINIIHTDKEFIKNHSDIFNETVTAYMTSAVLQEQFKKDKSLSGKPEISQCFKDKKFIFSNCLQFFNEKYKPYFSKKGCFQKK